MRRIIAAIASAVLWAAAYPAAQAPAQPPPVFRAGTDLVEIDVVVHGKDGAFVGDLSADDFVVEEGGRAQPIQQFYLHLTGSPGWTTTTPAVARDSSNAAPASAALGRVFVVVFDD